MKRLLTYLITLILIVTTIGVNLSAQVCDGVLMSMSINNISITTEEGEEMSCCTGDDSTCPTCEHHDHSFQLNTNYTVGQIISIYPTLSSLDWFHGDLPTLFTSFITVEEGGDQAEYHYQSPYHPCHTLLHRGLRAPPTYC